MFHRCAPFHVAPVHRLCSACAAIKGEGSSRNFGTVSTMAARKVSYFIDNDIGGYYFGEGHVMKPHRVTMAHNLVLAYGLYRKMDVYKPRKASPTELTQFHSQDYISFLSRITPDNVKNFSQQMYLFNVGKQVDHDCPVFDGLFDFCRSYAAASIDGARLLMTGRSDIAINWAGGLHHAKKTQAYGFCFVNDIVLAILELLKYYPRVLYIDIDAHHGDGVEEAFYVTDRVMTLSFHHYEHGFFPGTGNVFDTGHGRGQYYAVNCPLRRGIGDAQYEELFKPVVSKVLEMFQPSAIVLQCGTDSLAHDRLGGLNLSIRGHGQCVSFVKSFNIPTLVLGGGGYTIRNVARCWAYETGLLVGCELDETIPYNDYWEYFKPDFQLHVGPESVASENSTKYLNELKEKVLENLRCLDGAPSVALHDLPPMDFLSDDDSDSEAPSSPFQREANGEFYDDHETSRGNKKVRI